MTPAGRGAAAFFLLIGSNACMTTAWYLHLKRPQWSLIAAIFFSWLIAGFEYCLQVPANRLGHVSYGGPFSAPQLKVIQELISLSAFAVFSTTVLREKLRWSDGVGFVLIVAGVAVAMAGREMAARKDAAGQRAYEQLPPPPAALELAPMPPPPPPRTP